MVRRASEYHDLHTTGSSDYWKDLSGCGELSPGAPGISKAPSQRLEFRNKPGGREQDCADHLEEAYDDSVQMKEPGFVVHFG